MGWAEAWQAKARAQLLGFAVGAWRVGAVVQVPQVQFPAGRPPAAVDAGGPVVGHHLLNREAAFGVPARGAAQEGDRVLGAFRGQQLGVGQARVVVDGDVQELPAGTVAEGAALLRQQRLAWRPEAAQLLDVDVQQLARSRS